MDLDTDVVKGLRMYTSGDTRKLAFTIDDQKINEILTAVTSATAETYKERGVTLDMKINESNGEMTVNKAVSYTHLDVYKRQAPYRVVDKTDPANPRVTDEVVRCV